MNTLSGTNLQQLACQVGAFFYVAGLIMSRAHVYLGFSDNCFYNHFKSMMDCFKSPLIDSEIIFGTMVFHWDDQGGLIHTSTLESGPVDAYHEVGHLYWDTTKPNVLHCVDTDSNEGGDGDSNANQSN